MSAIPQKVEGIYAVYDEQGQYCSLEQDTHKSGKMDTIPQLNLEDTTDELASLKTTPTSTAHQRRTTDLVGLYLKEIGRVRLLDRDEEVSEAQQVQRYLHLLEMRKEILADNPALAEYVCLTDVRDRLTAKLGHRPSLERWAQEADIPVADLRLQLAAGQSAWAEKAELSIAELDQIIKQGIRAKEHLIQANLRLVVSVAKKYQNRGLELLDLIQEGTLGLERAVEKFDPTQGYRFSTYAYWWIRQGVTRAIASQSRVIRLPTHITEKLNKIKKAQRQLSQSKGQTATIEDIAQELDTTSEHIRKLLASLPRSFSLETKVGKDKDTELGELLEANETSPEQLIIRESLQKELGQLLADLTSREQAVLTMRFGLNHSKTYSLAQIGQCLDLSRERVRQIETKALQKLRQPTRCNRIQDFLGAFA